MRRDWAGEEESHGFDAARRAYAILEGVDKADPDGASGFKGHIQTAMAILLTMMPEHADHDAVCGARCMGCAFDSMREAAGHTVSTYDGNGTRI